MKRRVSVTTAFLLVALILVQSAVPILTSATGSPASFGQNTQKELSQKASKEETCGCTRKPVDMSMRTSILPSDKLISGPIHDCCCNADKVDALNGQILPILDQLAETDFFRYYKLNLWRDCHLFPDDGQCASRSCAVDECPAAEFLNVCPGHSSGNIDSSLDVDHFKAWSEDGDPWTNDAEVLNQGEHMNYVDLMKNPERYTGYSGVSAARIWKAIYEENCFLEDDASQTDLVRTFDVPHEQCVEKRVFYRLISGLHSSITTHLTHDFSVDLSSQVFSPNVERFYETVAKYPTRVHNLYLTYLMLLRAVSKALPTFLNLSNNLMSGQDLHLHSLISQLAAITTTCPNTFDENTMFRGDDALALKTQFKNHFRNISVILDCVACERCKLWGKLQINGLGTALKILFDAKQLGEAAILPLERTELVALLHTFRRLSESLKWANEMFKQYSYEANFGKSAQTVLHAAGGEKGADSEEEIDPLEAALAKTRQIREQMQAEQAREAEGVFAADSPSVENIQPLTEQEQPPVEHLHHPDPRRHDSVHEYIEATPSGQEQVDPAPSSEIDPASDVVPPIIDSLPEEHDHIHDHEHQHDHQHDHYHDAHEHEHEKPHSELEQPLQLEFEHIPTRTGLEEAEIFETPPPHRVAHQSPPEQVHEEYAGTAPPFIPDYQSGQSDLNQQMESQAVIDEYEQPQLQEDQQLHEEASAQEDDPSHHDHPSHTHDAAHSHHHEHQAIEAQSTGAQQQGSEVRTDSLPLHHHHGGQLNVPHLHEAHDHKESPSQNGGHVHHEHGHDHGHEHPHQAPQQEVRQPPQQEHQHEHHYEQTHGGHHHHHGRDDHGHGHDHGHGMGAMDFGYGAMYGMGDSHGGGHGHGGHGPPGEQRDLSTMSEDQTWARAEPEGMERVLAYAKQYMRKGKMMALDFYWRVALPLLRENSSVSSASAVLFPLLLIFALALMRQPASTKSFEAPMRDPTLHHRRTLSVKKPSSGHGPSASGPSPHPESTPSSQSFAPISGFLSGTSSPLKNAPSSQAAAGPSRSRKAPASAAPQITALDPSLSSPPSAAGSLENGFVPGKSSSSPKQVSKKQSLSPPPGDLQRRGSITEMHLPPSLPSTPPGGASKDFAAATSSASSPVVPPSSSSPSAAPSLSSQSSSPALPPIGTGFAPSTRGMGPKVTAPRPAARRAIPVPGAKK